MNYISDLRKKLEEYVNYIDQNIADEIQKAALKQRTADLFLEISDVVQNILDYNEIKLLRMTKAQENIDKKMGKIEAMFQNIQNDIYGEEECEFDIVCPYCNKEFTVDGNEENTEIQCPECKNMIELDWNLDDECSGNCSHCKGCSDEEDDED